MRSLKPTLIVVAVSLSLLASGFAFGADRSPGGGVYKGGGSSRGGDHKGGHYSGRSYRGGHYWGGGHKGSYHRGSVDVVIGGSFWGPPWYYPSYYYPYYPYYYPYYYPPVVEVPSSPPVYIERSQPELSESPGIWFYCPDSKTYYPYVKECKGGWQTVPAKPPSEQER